MRHTFKKAALAALIVTSGINAAAAESVQVNVIGTIIPAACTPTVASGGIFDYGNIRADSLSADEFTTLQEMSLDFGIRCDAPAKVAIRAINDRPGTLAGATEAANGNGHPNIALLGGNRGAWAASGLGLDGTHQIGGYAMVIRTGTVTVDDNTARSIHINNLNGTGTWSTDNYGYVISSIDRMISWATPEGNTPIAFENMAGKLTVQAYINRASELDLSHAIHLDGQTTLEVVYL